MFKDSEASRKFFGWGFIFSQNWEPNKDDFGALTFIYGTVVSSLIALAIALPISLGIAIFLSELASPVIKNTLSFLVEILAAIPSIVYGFWGVFVLAPFIKDYVQSFFKSSFGFLYIFGESSSGLGLFTASLILAIMITPIISSITGATCTIHCIPAATSIRIGVIRSRITHSVQGGITRTGTSGIR